MPPSFPPREEKQGHLPTEEVMTMMRSFQRMTDALTNRLDREASGALNHGKGARYLPAICSYGLAFVGACCLRKAGKRRERL
uniref:Uncharacterized protein n=1 Tax=Picea glauca TaxID=3330 RepID=A0A101LVJ6_PICGL|nr:hypothetical protein ABT39_MTgene1960 [Picea glauca]